MLRVIQDFVNREEQLFFLRQVANHRANERVVLVEGRLGIGKTSLLAEFGEECRQQGVASAYIDLNEKTISEGYLSIIETLRRQLGPKGFAQLDAKLHEMRRAALPPGTFQAQEMPVQAQPAVEASGVTGSKKSIAQSNIAFYGTVYAPGGNFAGRDIITYIQAEPLQVQEWFREEITEALLACLQASTQNETVIFLLDHWESSNSVTRKWLQDSLIDWTLSHKLPNAASFIASELAPGELLGLRGCTALHVEDLPEQAVRTYWVDLHGLPAEHLEGGRIRLYGYPPLLQMTARELARKLESGK